VLLFLKSKLEAKLRFFAIAITGLLLILFNMTSSIPVFGFFASFPEWGEKIWPTRPVWGWVFIGLIIAIIMIPLLNKGWYYISKRYGLED